MSSAQINEMPTVAHGYSAEVEYDNSGVIAPEVKGYATIKGTGISKYKEVYVVLESNAISVYKDAASSSSPGSSLLTFMIMEATIAKEILDKKETAKTAELGFLIEAPPTASVGKSYGAGKKIELFCCFPTLGIYNEWIRQIKYGMMIASPAVFGVPVRIASIKNRGQAPYPIVRLIKFLEDVNKNKNKNNYIYILFLTFFTFLILSFLLIF